MRAHLLGVAAGAMLFTGLLAMQVAETGPPDALLAPTTFYALQQSAVLIGALWGIFIWKDFRGGQRRVWGMLWAFIVLFSLAHEVNDFGKEIIHKLLKIGYLPHTAERLL